MANTGLNDKEALPCLVSKVPRRVEICHGVSPNFKFTCGSGLITSKTVPNCRFCNKELSEGKSALVV